MSDENVVFTVDGGSECLALDSLRSLSLNVHQVYFCVSHTEDADT